MNRQLLEKSDVYTFGVVMLQFITAKGQFSNLFGEVRIVELIRKELLFQLNMSGTN
jgi:hypothetical protein